MVRRECGIGDDFEILVAVSTGYEDSRFQANRLIGVGRENTEKCVTFME